MKEKMMNEDIVARSKNDKNNKKKNASIKSRAAPQSSATTPHEEFISLHKKVCEQVGADVNENLLISGVKYDKKDDSEYSAEEMKAVTFILVTPALKVAINQWKVILFGEEALRGVIDTGSFNYPDEVFASKKILDTRIRKRSIRKYHKIIFHSMYRIN